MFAQSSPVPFHMNPLMKGALSGIPEANFKASESVPTTSIYASSSFNSPMEQHSVNHPIFRRYPNGQLDFSYAVHRLIDVLDEFKLGVVSLTEEQELVLSCLMPSIFKFIDYNMVQSHLTTTLRITSMEKDEIVARLGEFLYEREKFRTVAHC